MKKITFLLTISTLVLCFNCNVEKVDEDIENLLESKFSITESTVNHVYSKDCENCSEFNLIAGQNEIAGTVTIEMDTENLTITYETNIGWTIDLTHLSIGDCSEQWVPTTGSGNPKVGKFEHTEPHHTSPNQVIYSIDLDLVDIDDNGDFCVAAHAEVNGPTGGETAWADGLEFDGNSWATYIQTNISAYSPATK